MHLKNSRQRKNLDSISVVLKSHQLMQKTANVEIQIVLQMNVIVEKKIK